MMDLLFCGIYLHHMDMFLILRSFRLVNRPFDAVVGSIHVIVTLLNPKKKTKYNSFCLLNGEMCLVAVKMGEQKRAKGEGKWKIK